MGTPELNRRIAAIDAFVRGERPTYRGLRPDDIVWLDGRPEVVHHVCPVCAAWKEETSVSCDRCAGAVSKLMEVVK